MDEFRAGQRDSKRAIDSRKAALDFSIRANGTRPNNIVGLIHDAKLIERYLLTGDKEAIEDA